MRKLTSLGKQMSVFVIISVEMVLVDSGYVIDIRNYIYNSHTLVRLHYQVCSITIAIRTSS